MPGCPERPLHVRDRVLVKHGARTVRALVAGIEGVLELDDLAISPADELALNDIGRLRLRLAEPLPAADYATSRADGAFLLIDPQDGWTLGAGMVRDPKALETPGIPVPLKGPEDPEQHNAGVRTGI